MFAQALVPASALSLTTTGPSSIDSSPYALSRSYASDQMHSVSYTSQRPSRVPPHGPLRWFFAHCDSGQTYAISGSEQSPQSLQPKSGTFAACSSAWATFRTARGPLSMRP